MSALIAQAKYIAKSLIAGIGSYGAYLLATNQTAIEDAAAAFAGSVIVGVLAWWKANGPKPS